MFWRRGPLFPSDRLLYLKHLSSTSFVPGILPKALMNSNAFYEEEGNDEGQRREATSPSSHLRASAADPVSWSQALGDVGTSPPKPPKPPPHAPAGAPTPAAETNPPASVFQTTLRTILDTAICSLTCSPSVPGPGSSLQWFNRDENRTPAGSSSRPSLSG